MAVNLCAVTGLLRSPPFVVGVLRRVRATCLNSVFVFDTLPSDCAVHSTRVITLRTARGCMELHTKARRAHGRSETVHER